MAERLLRKKGKRKIAPGGTRSCASASGGAGVVVGNYKERQLAWIRANGVYNWPVREEDGRAGRMTLPRTAALADVKELWLYASAKSERHVFAAEYVGRMTQAEFLAAHPSYAKLGPSKHAAYYVFKTKGVDCPPELGSQTVIARTADFGRRCAKVKQAIERFRQDGEFAPLAAYLPKELGQVPRQQLRVCEAAVQMMFFGDAFETGTFEEKMKETKKAVSKTGSRPSESAGKLCKSIASYSRSIGRKIAQKNLFAAVDCKTEDTDIRVVELFAGVGGFRIGLERASKRFKTVWNNQWEPSTKRQDASNVYQLRFGPIGHCNEDIATIPAADIPQADLLVGGFPCQDYSVATTLKNSGGIEGKKGVLWWQIHRILRDKGKDAPRYLMLENVDRLLKSPANQRGRDFAIILASLSDLGYCVEWRVINAADYGMPQRRRRTYIVAYKNGTQLADEARQSCQKPIEWLTVGSVEAQAFESKMQGDECEEFDIDGDLAEVTENFNAAGAKNSPFMSAGFMIDRHVYTADLEPVYDGPRITLGQIVVDEDEVSDVFFISDEDLKEWRYLKGPKSEERVSVDKDGNEFTYHYSEGGMAFPDALDRPSRTIITGEGGPGASRFKHVIQTPSGRFRRLIPLELERLNMFPDNHTEGASDIRRAFLMGNALVTGIVERIGIVLKERI